VAVLYVLDVENDCAAATASAGPESESFPLMRVPLGHGVAGWVAVNNTAIVNADPKLDLGDEETRTALVRTTCVPVNKHHRTVGAISVYSADLRGFADDDRRQLEQLADALAERWSYALDLLRGNASENAEGTPATVH
jgi:putative methionine-R-sulfoxide reductase with GAF domain